MLPILSLGRKWNVLLGTADTETVRHYKREAERWGLQIPSLAGIWDPGVKIHSPNAADSKFIAGATGILGCGRLI